ncbi:hypothetical protein [Azonexus sp.]|jgi:hypothetical protein|uniref:hypothetical protein n=1 Tax=Azonexus sp. TaxID=1872668 RepID=UPI00282D4952|nr:hypothetical protein [Azonexus sp.]MDR1995448.1 hypothetical protein [Azonexus sp.]
MPYEIIWEPEGVLVTFSGRVTARDLINSVRQMHADGRFDERHYVINELPDDAGWELSEEAFVELSALHYGAYASHPNCRIVFVTTDATLAELIKRILTAPEMASYEIAVFDSPSTARSWLDKQPNLHVMSNVMGFRLR